MEGCSGLRSATGMRMELAAPQREHKETKRPWTQWSWSGGRAELGCAAAQWKKAQPKSNSVCSAQWEGAEHLKSGLLQSLPASRLVWGWGGPREKLLLLGQLESPRKWGEVWIKDWTDAISC